MRHQLWSVTVALASALACWSCGDSTSPPAQLSLSAASRSVSIGEDSLDVMADSVEVRVSGPGSGTTSWVVTHGGASWLTLVTTGGTGSGVLRWERDPGPLTAGTYVDTITVSAPGSTGGIAKLVDTLVVRAVPAQFISVRRAWRPGERDSVVAFVLRTRVWGEWSDLAPLALAGWDSTSDIVPNPLYHPAAGAAGPSLAPQWSSGWSSLGMDIRIVFDSTPDVVGVEKDSLDWVMTFWWNPSEAAWKGYVVKATTDTVWAQNPASGSTIDTITFDDTYGKSGLAGGEGRLRVDSATYWEAYSGKYWLTYNSGFGALQVISSGPYTGGNFQTGGSFGGRLLSVSMPREWGNTAPTTQSINWDFRTARINAQRIWCYFTPVTPPTGYSSCTGSAYARIIALARAGRALETLSGSTGRR